MKRSTASADRSRGPTLRKSPSSGQLRAESSVARVGRYLLYTQEYGSGEQTLILLHGLSGSSRWWARNIPALAERYRVVVPDLVGFGRSRTRIRLPDIATLAHLVGSWLRARQAKRVTLVGHSMGGQIAIHLAAKEPEGLERLCLVDSAGIPPVLSPVSLLRFAADVGPLWRWGDPGFLATIAGDAVTAGPRSIVRALRNILRDDVRELLPEIKLPTLIIWGERDQLVPLSSAMELRDRISGSSLVVLRGAAHNPMIDRAEDFNRVLIRFLDGEPVGR